MVNFLRRRVVRGTGFSSPSDESVDLITEGYISSDSVNIFDNDYAKQLPAYPSGLEKNLTD